MGQKVRPLIFFMSMSDTGEGVKVGRDTDAGVEVKDEVEECRVGGLVFQCQCQTQVNGWKLVETQMQRWR